MQHGLHDGGRHCAVRCDVCDAVYLLDLSAAFWGREFDCGDLNIGGIAYRSAFFGVGPVASTITKPFDTDRTREHAVYSSI